MAACVYDPTLAVAPRLGLVQLASIDVQPGKTYDDPISDDAYGLQ
jgi:hypothetical protein